MFSKEYSFKDCFAIILSDCYLVGNSFFEPTAFIILFFKTSFLKHWI
nr:MAG TPA: hypothetical protein [Caudoviricetes sp.]